LCIRLCLKTRSGFERLIFRLAASGCIDDKANIACFAVFARRDGVFRQSLADAAPNWRKRMPSSAKLARPNEYLGFDAGNGLGAAHK